MNAFKIDRNELFGTLQKLKPGLASKGIVEQSTHFMFLGDDVATFSDQIAIIHPFEIGKDADERVYFSVKGDEFYKIISGTEAGELNFTLEDDQLTITSESTSAGMPTLLDDKDKVEKLVNNLKKEMNEWAELPEDFIQGLYLCMFSAAKDLSMGTLSCIYVKEENIFSSDSIRASWAVISGEMPEFLIPVKDVQELVKFTNLTHYCESDNWIHFKTADDVTFSAKKILGTFKNLRKRFNIQGTPIELPSELAETLNSITFLSDGDVDMNKTISIKIDKNKIICRAEKQTGWIEKKLDFKYKGAAIQFLVNPIFLAQVLSKTTSMILSDTCALFQSDGFSHIIMLPLED